MVLELAISRMLTKMSDQLLGHFPEGPCFFAVFFAVVSLEGLSTARCRAPMTIAMYA